MKKTIFTLLLIALFGNALFAQPEGVVKKATSLPVIDGTIDEVWAIANVYNIDKPFLSETPTLGISGETTWQALWSIDGIYILLKVTDNIWQPAYSGDVPGQNWMYDKPEIYFDVNYLLADGIGGGGGLGHYQVAPGFTEGETDGTPTTETNGVVYAFKVTAPNYLAEYFIPFTLLKDNEGKEVDKTGTIGFDVTIIDGDVKEAVRNRNVWANDVDPESYSSMDNCGTITLEGAGDAVLATSITIGAEGDASTIETEAGTLQMIATILPVDATYQTVSWSVEQGTGRASISTTGLLTAQMDGTVTVIADAKDGSNKTATKEITISNQFVTISDVNLIKNGDFNTDGAATSWGFWSGNGGETPVVVDGVAVCAPVLSETEGWQYQFNQSGLTALADVNYIFSFVAWSDAERTINVDFEDTGDNGYTRYGTDLEAGGNADWTFTIGTDPENARYTYHVVFDKMIETTVQKVQFMLAQSADYVYLDSIYLISEDDFEKVTFIGVGVDKPSVKNISVYPNPVIDVLNINLLKANSKIVIYNSLGRIEAEFIAKDNVARVDVRNFASGLYFVKVNDDSVVKFIK